MAETDEHLPEPQSEAPAERPKRAYTFLGRLALAAREQNWFAVVLELVIVVVGVLVALAANDWAAARQDRQLELETLRELRQALSNDVAQIELIGGAHRSVANSMRVLMDHRTSTLPYEDSLGIHLSRIGSSSAIVRDMTAYETLKQRGLGTVTNDSLRIAIGRLYGNSYEELDAFQEGLQAHAIHFVIPLSAQHLADFVIFEKATPVDYEAFRTAPEVSRILSDSYYLHRETADLCDDMTEQIRLLLAQIDEEIATSG